MPVHDALRSTHLRTPGMLAWHADGWQIHYRTAHTNSIHPHPTPRLDPTTRCPPPPAHLTRPCPAVCPRHLPPPTSTQQTAGHGTQQQGPTPVYLGGHQQGSGQRWKLLWGRGEGGVLSTRRQGTTPGVGQTSHGGPTITRGLKQLLWQGKALVSQDARSPQTNQVLSGKTDCCCRAGSVL
jgi:hypothetical protein